MRGQTGSLQTSPLKKLLNCLRIKGHHHPPVFKKKQMMSMWWNEKIIIWKQTIKEFWKTLGHPPPWESSNVAAKRKSKGKLSKRREVRQPAMHSRGGERKGAVFPSYRPVHPGSKSGILYTNYCACKQEPESCTLLSQVDLHWNWCWFGGNLKICGPG